MPHIPPIEKLVVVKHNDLIDAAQQLSVLESRIILTCISRVNSKEVLDPSIKFVLSVEDIKDLVGVGGRSAYENLRDAVNRLAERWVVLLKPSKRISERKIRWVSEIAYIPTEGVIELFFTPSISNLLSDITKNFTQYKLENVLGFKCIYSIRFYELFKRWGGTGKEIDLEDLQELLELGDKYARWDNFKAKVLIPVVKDINETSDVKVSWDQVHRGKRVSGIIFAYSLPKKVTTQKKAPTSKPAEAKSDLSHKEELVRRFGEDIVKKYKM
jgi:plasmid replication initiation protein